MTINQNRKGFSSIISLILIIILLIIAGAVFIAAKVIVKLPGNSNTVKSTLNSNSSSCQFNDKNFCKFYSLLQNSDKFYTGGLRLTVKANSSNGISSKSVWETDGEKNGRVYTYNPSGIKTSDTILIGKVVYTLDTNSGKWSKQSFTSFSTDINSDTNIADIKQFIVGKIVDKLSNASVSYVDQEECGSNECMKYQVKLSTLNKTQEFILFNSRTYLLYGTTSKASDGYSEVSHLENTSISISTPSSILEP